MRGLCLGLCLALFAGCRQVRRASVADRLSETEKLEYVTLAALDEHAARTYALEPGKAGRREFLSWFWERAAGTDTLETRESYFARAGEARRLFGATDLLNDERVRIYIRFGPARREAYEPEPYHSETLTVIVNPAEIWTYEELGRQFDFVKAGTAFHLVGETRFGPGTIAPMLAETDAVPRMVEPHRSAIAVGFDFAVARFESENDTVRTEVHYGIPVRDLARLEELGVAPVVSLVFDWQARVPANSHRRRVNVVPVVADSSVAGLAVGQQVFRLRADDYRLSVRLDLPDGSSAVFDHRVNLLDYVRREQPVSDIAFYSLADSSFQSPQFADHGWQRLVPAVRPVFRSGGTCYVLYELYNLATDSTGDHRVEASYELIDEQTRNLAVIPTPPKFEAGPGSVTTMVERLHLMDLRPGSYLLVCRVRDLVSGRDLSLTARFRIQPRT